MMLALVALWALAEAILFFVVADVPIMAVGIASGWRRAGLAAILGALFAAIGGTAMLVWARADPEASRAVLENLPGVSAALVDRAAAEYRGGGWWAMLAGSFSGVPYKLYAHAAGIAGAGIASFAATSIITRLPRFLLIALVGGTVGAAIRRRLGARWTWGLFVLSWTVFYGFYWSSLAQ